MCGQGRFPASSQALVLKSEMIRGWLLTALFLRLTNFCANDKKFQLCFHSLINLELQWLKIGLHHI